MGKGGGCFPSKTRPPIGVPPDNNTQASPAPLIPEEPAEEEQSPQIITVVQDTSDGNHDGELVSKKRRLKIYIIFYSMYGHVEILARKVKQGVDSIEGVEGVLYRVPETLANATLDQMRAPHKGNDEVPSMCVEEMVNADGFLFGFPTRFGSMAAQMNAFFDSTHELWVEQKLAGKPAGFFVSTGTQGGGQETTALTAIPHLVHHGMVYVPVGYTFGAGMFRMDGIRGGSPYGAGVYSGDGSREPSETELGLAEHQGRYMATLVKRFGPSP
ncbi:unnamed protein product [Linum tenue]|uniref:NAD(P)H dehydrogenase (quinone) n=1 Tax=Linum tenue TaxID=586396 RepID=A0AAV0LX27_9ROSI|nr:unnamed protein product [Linum tenue]